MFVDEKEVSRSVPNMSEPRHYQNIHVAYTEYLQRDIHVRITDTRTEPIAILFKYMLHVYFRLSVVLVFKFSTKCLWKSVFCCPCFLNLANVYGKVCSVVFGFLI